MNATVSVKRKRSVIDMINEHVQEKEQWLDQSEESHAARPSWNKANCSINPLKNIRVTPKEVTITVDLPFTKEDTVKVKAVNENTIEISASMKRIMHLHELGIKHHEAELKKFHCETRVPVPLNTEKMQINFKKGILKICIPRKTVTKIDAKQRSRK